MIPSKTLLDYYYFVLLVIESNISYVHNSSLIPLDHSTIPVGCRYDKLSWCLDLPKLTYYQYGLGMVLLSYGYCSATLTCYSMFSKIIGPNPQVRTLRHSYTVF